MTIKLAMLLVVVVAGVPASDRERLNPSEWASPVSVVVAGMLVFVAYEGFELISNASSEMVDPARTLPRAYGLSVGIVVVLYVAIAAVVVASLSPAEIQASSDFALAEAASASLGQVIAVALPLESISSLCSSIFLGVFTVVNVAAFRAGADAAVRRPIAACGAVASACSLVVLTARNVAQDPRSLAVLGALVAAALIVEHGLFGRSGRTLALDTKS